MNERKHYHVKVLKRARKTLLSLPSQLQERLTKAINHLADDPRPSGCLRMTGVESWRIRVGDYRIVYDIEDSELIVLVVAVGHRREIYR